MFCKNLWEQHRAEVTVAGVTLRYLRYCDYMGCIERSGITPEDIGKVAYVQNKLQCGAEPTEEELATFEAVNRKMPVEGWMACCFKSPAAEGPEHMRHILYGLSEDDRAIVRLALERLIDSTPVGVNESKDVLQLMQAGVPIVHDLDSTNITLQQALVMFEAAAKTLKQEG